MARPLNKKYFGNRNIGTTGTSDNAIGGEGIASINWSTLGAFAGNSNVAVLTAPALPAPTLPGGVQATWTIAYEVEGVSTGAGKTNLAVGDTFEYSELPGMIAKVTDISGANAVFSVTTTGASRGDALTLAQIPQDTIGINLTKIAGTGTAITFLVDVRFQVRTVTITEKGSGYTGAETFTFTKPGTTSGTVPAGTIVLTTDSGSYGNSGKDGSNMNSGNQENAIRMTAYLTGGSAAEVDIIKQVSAKRFKVTDGTRTGVVTLQDSLANAAGEGSIGAVDSDGGTYFITKIAARRATVTRGTGTQFATGQSVPWNMTAAVEDVSVKISNA